MVNIFNCLYNRKLYVHEHFIDPIDRHVIESFSDTGFVAGCTAEQKTHQDKKIAPSGIKEGANNAKCYR
jgi:hypothetical protein